MKKIEDELLYNDIYGPDGLYDQIELLQIESELLRDVLHAVGDVLRHGQIAVDVLEEHLPDALQKERDKGDEEVK